MVYLTNRHVRDTLQIGKNAVLRAGFQRNLLLITSSHISKRIDNIASGGKRKMCITCVLTEALWFFQGKIYIPYFNRLSTAVQQHLYNALDTI